MRQRVKLAQALVHDPELLLLDEPTNGLDPEGRRAMLTLVHRIGTEFGLSVLICSHLLGEIERICTSLVAIDGGRLLRSASLSSMTAAQDLLMVEVDEDPAALAARLAGDGLTVRLAERGLLVQLSDEDTYDVIRDAVADLDLSLHRLERRRHQVADLFRDKDPA
jgi:ABC-2 type transport system ATP-binding protein